MSFFFFKLFVVGHLSQIEKPFKNFFLFFLVSVVVTFLSDVFFLWNGIRQKISEIRLNVIVSSSNYRKTFLYPLPIVPRMCCIGVWLHAEKKKIIYPQCPRDSDKAISRHRHFQFFNLSDRSTRTTATGARPETYCCSRVRRDFRSLRWLNRTLF